MVNIYLFERRHKTGWHVATGSGHCFLSDCEQMSNTKSVKRCTHNNHGGGGDYCVHFE